MNVLPINSVRVLSSRLVNPHQLYEMLDKFLAILRYSDDSEFWTMKMTILINLLIDCERQVLFRVGFWLATTDTNVAPGTSTQ